MRPISFNLKLDLTPEQAHPVIEELFLDKSPSIADFLVFYAKAEPEYITLALEIFQQMTAGNLSKEEALQRLDPTFVMLDNYPQ